MTTQPRPPERLARSTTADRVKRGAIIAAVFVLLGVVTTYLVAWVAVGIVRDRSLPTGDWPKYYLVQSGRTGLWYYEHVQESLGRTSGALVVQSDVTDCLVRHGLEFKPRHEWAMPDVAFPPADWTGLKRKVEMLGWPFKCVWGTADGSPSATTLAYQEYSLCSPQLWSSRTIRGVIVPSPRGIDGRLPLGVIWSRFIPNVLIHAAILFTLWCGVPLAWRSARRRWYSNQHRCPACGYDRKGLATGALCPECGM